MSDEDLSFDDLQWRDFVEHHMLSMEQRRNYPLSWPARKRFEYWKTLVGMPATVGEELRLLPKEVNDHLHGLASAHELATASGDREHEAFLAWKEGLDAAILAGHFGRVPRDYLLRRARAQRPHAARAAAFR